MYQVFTYSLDIVDVCFFNFDFSFFFAYHFLKSLLL